MNATALDPESARLHRAFSLVTPDRFGARDWREPIDSVVTEAEIDAAAVSPEDLRRSVMFMTATEAIVSCSAVGPVRVYRVQAAGYRRGPAGP